MVYVVSPGQTHCWQGVPMEFIWCLKAFENDTTIAWVPGNMLTHHLTQSSEMGTVNIFIVQLRALKLGNYEKPKKPQ